MWADGGKPEEAYQVVRPIGSGSFGQVFLVSDKSDHLQYVMKAIELQSSSQDSKEAAESEAKLLSTCRHPNIVAYRDSFVDSGGYLCIVMEYCEHGDVSSYLLEAKRTQSVPEENILLEWFIQIVLALHSLHRKKIMHRDLKTQNIFISGCKEQANFALKLGDFGIAKMLNSTRDLAKTQIGTPFYMSPELINNKPYGVKSDIWGLGCVLYEIINGQRAFDAQSLNGLALKIIKGAYSPITSSCSKSTQNLIKSMLSKNPHHRPTLREILHSSFIRPRIPAVQRSVIASGPPEMWSSAAQVLSEQLAALGLGAPGAGTMHDKQRMAQRLQRAERKKQHEEEVLHHTIALLEECLQTPDHNDEAQFAHYPPPPPADAGAATHDSTHSGARGGVPSPRASAGVGHPQAPAAPEGAHKSSSRHHHQSPHSHHPSPFQPQQHVGAPHSHHQSHQSHYHAPAHAPARPRVRSDDLGFRNSHYAAPMPPPPLAEHPHTGGGGHGSAGRSGQSRRPSPPPPQYGGPMPPAARPEPGAGWRTGELSQAERSSHANAGPHRPPMHSVYLQSLPMPTVGSGMYGQGHPTVEQTRLPPGDHAASGTHNLSRSEDSMSSQSVAELQELEEWEGLSDASGSSWDLDNDDEDGEQPPPPQQQRSQALRQRIDDCQAAIYRHRLTIEMLEHSVVPMKQVAAESSGAPMTGAYSSSLSVVREEAMARRLVAPAVVQDCAARLMRRCLEGLGTEKFHAARRCLQLSLDSAELPDLVRSRMLDLLGMDKIGFLSMLDQLAHLERRWGWQEQA